MNVFIVHSGCDKEIVNQQVVQPLFQLEPRAKVLMLENGGAFWKLEAARLLKKAQMVLFVIGKNSSQSSNIGWELSQASKLGKTIVYIRLDDSYPIHQKLIGKDRFSGRKCILGSEAKDVHDIVSIITRYEDSDYPVFNTAVNDQNKTELLEQYRIFLQTSESLVERRQSVNNFYITANTAILSLLGICHTIVDTFSQKMTFIILLSIVGIILDISWSNLLTAYGMLNSSKMKVLSIIERQLPLSLYDSEWIIMSDKLNSQKYTSFTDSEKRIPKIFIILYIGLLIFCLSSIIISIMKAETILSPESIIVKSFSFFS